MKKITIGDIQIRIYDDFFTLTKSKEVLEKSFENFLKDMHVFTSHEDVEKINMMGLGQSFTMDALENHNLSELAENFEDYIFETYGYRHLERYAEIVGEKKANIEQIIREMNR